MNISKEDKSDYRIYSLCWWSRWFRKYWRLFV